jgi:hypothetical protein
MKLVLAYKNFAANRNISHIGLGVAAMNTQKSLTRAGVPTQVWPIFSADDLRARLAKDHAVTHINISAPWIPSLEMQKLLYDHPDVCFSVTCHSNVGFLQADSSGTRLFREGIALERQNHNFRMAGNSRRFVQWTRSTFASPCTHLPNIYFLDGTTNIHRPLWQAGPLRIGIFGATRPLKNLMSAAGAALELAQGLRADVELWMNSGRAEGGGEVIVGAIRALVDGLHWAKIVHSGWQTWAGFLETAAHMHLMLQPSYTESFNMVTADGVSRGVPSVVSGAVDWCPRHWQAEVDDVHDIARVARNLVRDPHAAAEGLAALESHNAAAVAAWKSYLAVA